MMSCSQCLCPPGLHSSPAGQRSVTFSSIINFLRWKDPHISLRTMDGTEEVKTEEERNQGAPRDHKGSVLCDSLHGSVHLADNGPTLRAVLCCQVCKVYRFLTEDQRWILVREQLSETPLCFSLPKQLLSALIQELTLRIQEVERLGDLSPHWDGLRYDVINHCTHLIGRYQDTLAELHRLSATSCFKSSGRKSERHLQFVPTNLHAQRMEVTDYGAAAAGVWYDVITFGAPADHHQNFKHGGLRRLIGKHRSHTDGCVSFSAAESVRAQQLLLNLDQLQPLVFGQAEELLAAAQEPDAARLRGALDHLARQTERLAHALKDELVSSALVAIRGGRGRACHVHANGLTCDLAPANQEGACAEDARSDDEDEEEEWDRTWANVAIGLNCIVAMVDRLQGREEPRPLGAESNGGEASTPPPDSASPSPSWQEQLLPLVVTLRDCVRAAVSKARSAMTFVVLQGAATPTVEQGPASLVHRRHAVFSQALSALVCGFMLRLHRGSEDPDFLLLLHSLGILCQFESLLSTYGEELGMLEDMEVGVSDLSQVTFTVTEAKTEQPDDLMPRLSGTWGSFAVEAPLTSDRFMLLPRELREGAPIRVHPVLFSIGINQQQSLAERFGDCSLQERVNQENCQRLRVYCAALKERLPHLAVHAALSDSLSSLERSLDGRKRKNVEVLWTAAAVCRAVGGVRLTSCKSAKDRTAMSVTLEQCVLLRDRHTLGHTHFHTALDCMRRDGCRIENVQKNIGSRKFAFSSVQLLTFPKLYRPPDGSYGSSH